MGHDLVVLCLLVGVPSLCASPATECPEYCTCYKHNQTMVCDGEGTLRWIPRSPDYIHAYYLKGAALQTLTSEHIQNLTFCRLYDLRFQWNTISRVEPSAFKSLKHLVILYLEQVYLPLNDTLSAFQELSSPIRTLVLHANHVDIKVLQASTFQHLSRLSKLTLNLQEIISFNTSGLKELRKLAKLNLNGNQLSEFLVDHEWPNLNQLFLVGNSLWEIPNFCSGELSLVSGLQRLELSGNAIREVNFSRLACVKSLSWLDLSQNRITRLRNNSFSVMTNLSVLYVVSLYSLEAVEDLAFNSSSLQKILFSMNPPQSRGKSRPENWFWNTPNLETLDMTNTKLRLSVRELKQFLLSLRNVKELILQRTGLSELPVGVFNHLRKLQKLLLTGNYINSWNKAVFVNVTGIRYICFQSCEIQIINETSFPLEFRLSVKSINLADNPFTCTCDLLWFRNWMKEVIANKSIRFLGYPRLYNCEAPNTKPFRLSDFNPTLSSCAKLNLYTLLMTLVLGVSLSLILVGLVIYRFRWYIFYWISLLRRRRQHQDLERELKYDAFVSYSNPHADWMYEELLDYLEGEIGLTLCEHNRDFVPGNYIVDNIFDALDLSRKTILVISNDYMKSHWCNFELVMAFDGFLKRELDIVVILKEHIQARYVTSALRGLLTSVVYIEWSEEPEGKRLFRDRMVRALR